MNKIRILFSNVGIDKWPNDDRFTQKVDDLSKYSESSYHDVDTVSRNKYMEVSRLNIQGLYIPRKEYENPYKYGCYVNNKAFDKYLEQFFKDINKSMVFDVVIFQEFCSRYIDSFNFKSYFMQMYPLPGFINFLNIADEEKMKSRKAFLIGSNEYKIEILPFKKLSGRGKVVHDADVNNIDTGYGNIQVSKIVDHRHKNREIFIVNLHNRYKDDMRKFEESVVHILNKVKNFSNVLFVGDFNLVYMFKDTIEKNGFTYCQNDTCNLPGLYKIMNNSCEKNPKMTNLQIYYRLRDYTISLNNTNLKCEFDKNMSSHIFVDVTLTEKEINKGGKRYKLTF